MNINEIIHGFQLLEIKPFEEIKAEVYYFRHVQTDARLLWYKRDDENKTFSIAFKTTPVDDTGVFHILEHSVLNGSTRYPVREPFVDLLKGSLQTFLNAMTFADKTMYPISSRNDKDYINLMRVYLDAVFHPLVITTNQNTFRQEGWHYELFDENEDLTYKGVVFNEMKGAFSSPDSVRSRLMMHELFPDTTYGNESGGDPEYITDLSYEQFKEAHRKYYNPSNSYIILDGAVDIDNTLAIINDEYLSEFDNSGEKIVIEEQKAHIAAPVVREYEIGANEDPAGKAQISYGYVYGKYSDFEKTAALNMIASIICGSNESPLKKAIIDKGLGEDISFDISENILQPYVEISVVNTDLEKEEEIRNTIRTELERIVREGIDREELEAAINKGEFKAREMDFGGAPKGLVFAIISMDSWLYGGDPTDALRSEEVYASLREKLATSYFEDVLKEAILESNHSATVLLKPSNTLGAEKIQKEKEKLARIKASWSKEQIDEVIAMNKQLTEWQRSTDTPEEKATLPVLHLSDLKKTPTRLPIEICKHNGETLVMKHDLDTNGISYVTLYAEADDLNTSDISIASLMKALLTSLRTEKYGVLELVKKMKGTLGDFSVSFGSYSSTVRDNTDVRMEVSFSSLHRNDMEAVELVKEIIYHTQFDDTNAIRNIVKQIRMGMEQAVLGRGDGFGVTRLMAYDTEAGVVTEHISGYEYYRFIKNLDEKWDEVSEAVISRMKELYGKLFTLDRLAIGVTSLDKEALVEAILQDVPTGEAHQKVRKEPLGHKREGIIIPANISFATKGYYNREAVKENKGVINVLSNILTYDYLWNQVRVLGGAYGTGFSTRSNGYLRFSSYRDPNPANSLKVYRNTPEYLRAFVENDDDIEKYIVGTTGDYDPLLSERLKAKMSEVEYLSETTYEQKCDTLNQILSVSKEKIKKIIPLFEEVNEADNICVFGNAEALKACADALDDIHEF